MALESATMTSCGDPDDEVRTVLNVICGHLELKIDDYIGFDPQGAGPCKETPSRVAEFIGYYLLQAPSIPAAVRPHLAGLIMRSIELAVLRPDTRNLADMFLRTTCEEWKHAVVQHFDTSLDDFLMLPDVEGWRIRKELSEALALKFPAVDWALANADATRISDFVKLCNTQLDATGWTRAIPNLGMLILHSVDAAMQTRKLNAQTRRKVQTLMERLCKHNRAEWQNSTHRGTNCFVESSLLDFLGYESYNPRKILSDELGLEFPAVDWTTHNADPARASEYLELYIRSRYSNRPIAWLVWLGDLAIASLNKLICIRQLTSAERKAAERLIREQRGDQAENLARWTSLGCRPLVELICDGILTGDSTGDETPPPDFYGIYECKEAGESAQVVQFFLNRALQLQNSGQDWGIINSDPARVAEFIRYYFQRRNQFRIYRSFLVDLIFSSLNDALRQGPMDLETTTLSAEFIKIEIDCPSHRTVYWSRYGLVGWLIRQHID